MRRDLRVLVVLALGLSAWAQDARAQWGYPRGYGGYGRGGWGSMADDPASGYMTGLGNFARGQGAYEVANAQAQAINYETMVKWNQTLRARQKEIQEQQARDDARRRAQRDARVSRAELADGTTLNNLLSRISDFDPAAVKSSKASAPLGPGAIREIPFEWNTEAVSACIDDMRGRGPMPDVLEGDRFADDRAALAKAADAALKEDAKGDVSRETMRQLLDAISDFRAKFVKDVPETNSDYPDGSAYFSTLASLACLLHDPSMKKTLAEIDNFPNPTLGRLIAFMQSYNLRFGPATSDRQVRIYEGLASMLAAVLKDVNRATPAPPAAGGDLPAAARDAFKGMNWDQLQAHDRDP